MPLVSFVIPAHDEEELLPATLRAIHAAAATLRIEHEIIVADDSSTDRTAEVARSNGARVVQVQHRQIAATRNSGAREALGERIIFVDADTLVPADTLRAGLDALDKGAAGGGAGVNFDGPVPLYARLLVELLVLVFRWTKLAGGCFIFTTKQAFTAAGGFNEEIYASEELYLCRALRAQGPFVVLRERVTTSGRKIRTFSSWEILGVIFKGLFLGPGFVRKRDGLDIWYGPRREDPFKPQPPADPSSSQP